MSFSAGLLEPPRALLELLEEVWLPTAARSVSRLLVVLRVPCVLPEVELLLAVVPVLLVSVLFPVPLLELLFVSELLVLLLVLLFVPLLVVELLSVFPELFPELLP